MKKSLVINMNSNAINDLPESFKAYFPKEDSYEKISTLSVIDYDYVYVVNFKNLKATNLESLFKDKHEDFYIECNSFSTAEIQNVIIAYENATYTFKRDIKFEKVESNINFLNDNNQTKESMIIAKSQTLCKNLVNQPSNELTIDTFTTFLQGLAKENNLDYSQINKQELKKLGAGGILAVNQASEEEAKIVKLNYNGANNDKKYSLVGKGIIFDTGGYSLKNPQIIVTMKTDMAGAATVVAVINAVAKLKLKVNLEVIVPITDNLINEKAYRPDDIITLMNEVTAEIISTDAEGRLILADALVMASNENPELIIDVATLTGAVEGALGLKTAGVFGNNKDYINKIIECSESVDEYAWHLPINDTHREAIKGQIATIKNVANPGGASTAAAFLENFVGDTNWVHIDIAGVGFDEKIGATANMVRPLIEFFSKVEEK